MKRLWQCIKEESGQDMVEYTLLLGFVALIAAGIMITVSPSVSTVWTVTNTDLSTAATSAS
jgi:Flp pilus assembly pilin Flp